MYVNIPNWLWNILNFRVSGNDILNGDHKTEEGKVSNQASCHIPFARGMPDDTVKLPYSGIKPEMFERILKFLYTGQIEIPQDKFEQVEKFSKEYEIQSLIDICRVYNEKQDEIDDAEIEEPVTVVVESNDTNCHLKEVNMSPKKFKCLDCHKAFNNSSSLSEHYALFRHGQLDEIPPCKDCGVSFSTKENEADHICKNILNTVNPDEISDTCSYCAMKCENLSMLREHEKSHHCQKCNRVFNSIEYCAFHTCEPRSKRISYECVECKKVYTSKQCFTNHRKVHTADDSLTCQFCGKKFLHRLPLKKHILTHTEAGNLKHSCNVCGEEFRLKVKLYNHCIKFSHMLDEVPYKCQTCGSVFSNDRDLNNHFRTHTAAKPFQCGECDKTYSSKLGLKLHINSHHLKKATHKCSKCGRKFAQSSHLHDHMRTHSSEKRHVCSFCGLAVASKINLKRHESKHTGDRSLICRVCHKTFAVRHDLRRHMRSHEPVSSSEGSNIEEIIQDMVYSRSNGDMDTT
uniref:zinc finger protein OZF-like n=1 Tax=Styela clava TaxID=7725 RepID=UPI001939E609|nr:zinc finger protein OZF-like [Styela clava]